MHLLAGVCLSGTVIGITIIALAESPVAYQPDMIVTLGIDVLLAGIALSVAVRIERLWVPIVMIPFGVLATGVSTAYHVVVNPGLVIGCSIARVGMGFPLPWGFTYHPAGDGRCIVPLAQLYPLLTPGPNIASFALDVVFYIAIGLAIIQLYRGVNRTTITRTIPADQQDDLDLYAWYLAVYWAPRSYRLQSSNYRDDHSGLRPANQGLSGPICKNNNQQGVRGS